MGISQKREANIEVSSAPRDTATPSNPRTPETASRQEFRHSLQGLKAITSWHLWGSAVMIVLLPAAIVFLVLPLLVKQPGPLSERSSSYIIQGLLGFMWVLSGILLFLQQHRLKTLRKDIVQQMDGATKNHVKAEKFYGLSILDPLTGLYNRRFGADRLEEEIERTDESTNPLLVLAIDFDRFKQINDKYGHAAGDLALKEFSRRLRRAIRACDVPIRVGGDEFLLILPECPPEKVESIWSRMGSIVLTLDKEKVPVMFSHGMAQYQVGDTPETMIKRADERLYAEKAKRKAAVGVDQSTATSASTSTKDSDSISKESTGSDWSAEIQPARARRSARVPKQIAISLIGSDLSGKAFSEQTNTIDLSRHGARVVSRYKLAPGQEIIIRCLETNREVEVRVVRAMRPQSGRHSYGVEFVGSTTDIWDIEVPLLTESEKYVDRSLFECSRCEGRENIENRNLVETMVTRDCKRCGSVTNWTSVLSDRAGVTVNEALGVRS